MNSIAFIQDLYWREPLWLLASLYPFALLILKKIISKNKASQYAEKELHPWVIFPLNLDFTFRFFNKNTAYLFAWLFFSISLAGPQTPFYQEDNNQKSTSNIMIVLDISSSMKAIDIKPSRLLRAKIEIHELLARAKNHRIGILLYAARPHLYVPLTTDQAALKYYLQSLESIILPTRGSDPVAALILANNELTQSAGKSTILLITDGDVSKKTSQINLSRLEELKQSGTPLYILGVGTPEGEALQQEDGTWLKYNKQDVVSRMDEQLFSQLAADYSGKYSAVTDDDSDWNTLYDSGIARHKQTISENVNSRIIWNEYYIYFLLPSLLLFWVSLTPYHFNLFKRNISRSVYSLFFMAMSIFFYSAPSTDAFAFETGFLNIDSTEHNAFREYNNQSYDAAVSLYTNLSDYRGYMGKGSSFYKMENYPEAARYYSLAVLNANNESQRGHALYNIANSYFRSGDFSRAINAYNDALKYLPDDKAINYNLEISIILKKNLEQRIQQQSGNINAKRQGRGPRTATADENTDLSNNNGVSSEGINNNNTKNIPLPSLPGITQDTLTRLLEAGLRNIQLASQEKQNSTGSDKGDIHEFSKSNELTATPINVELIADKQHLLWKRMFEIEEGFPAPVDTPHHLPGVQPW